MTEESEYICGGRQLETISINLTKIVRNISYLLYVKEVVTPFYIVTYCIKWVTTSWTGSITLSEATKW